MRHYIVGAVLVAASCAAAAQVNRCTDAAGKVSYSDQPCGTAAKSAAQVLGSDATAPRYDPYAAERNLESIERATAISREMSGRSIEQAQSPGRPTILNAPAPRASALDTAPAPRRDQTAARKRAPVQMVNCDPAGCWGAGNGVRYTYAAGGNMTGSNGSFCLKTGPQFLCN